MLGTGETMRADFILPGTITQANSAICGDLLEDLTVWETSEWDDTCRSPEASACKRESKENAGLADFAAGEKFHPRIWLEEA
jgi:hypothetical protein